METGVYRNVWCCTRHLACPSPPANLPRLFAFYASLMQSQTKEEKLQLRKCYNDFFTLSVNVAHINYTVLAQVISFVSNPSMRNHQTGSSSVPESVVTAERCLPQSLHHSLQLALLSWPCQYDSCCGRVNTTAVVAVSIPQLSWPCQYHSCRGRVNITAVVAVSIQQLSWPCQYHSCRGRVNITAVVAVSISQLPWPCQYHSFRGRGNTAVG